MMKKQSNHLVAGTVFLWVVLLHALISCTDNTASENTLDDLISEQNFLIPPATAKPWVYYWWLKGNVSRDLITRDLEQMKEKGIGGFLLFDSRGYWDDYHGRTGPIPVPLDIKHEFMSSGWREMVKHTMKEANRLGLKMSINLANTGGSLRGPWDMKENGPKQLIWTATDVTGPSKVEAQVKIPSDKKYYKEVALIAVRVKTGENSSGNKLFFDLNGKWNTVAAPVDEAPVALEIIDLRDKLTDKNFQWDAPEGDWRIIRYGYHVIGEEGGVDILNSDAVTNYFHLMFEPATGAKKMERVFEKLILWNEHPETEINHFSGTATYVKSFDLPPAQANAPARLYLGKVHNVSRVWLNGQDLGIIWTAPWTVILSEYLSEGTNELKIEITNCWANRLIGDAGIPDDNRTVSTNVRLVPDRSEYQRGHQATSATDPLMPSGLAGPGLIEFGQSQPVTF